MTVNNLNKYRYEDIIINNKKGRVIATTNNKDLSRNRTVFNKLVLDIVNKQYPDSKIVSWVVNCGQGEVIAKLVKIKS